MYEKIELKTVLLEITDKCNLNCLHCLNRPKSDNIFMTYDQIINIIEKCKKHNAKNIYLSGGEPLLHPQIINILQYCIENEDIMFTITTNGLLLNETILKFIEDKKNIGIQISIDGITKDTYDKQRGSGSYDIFIEKIKLLTKYNIKNKTARTCVTKINYKEVGDIYEFLILLKIFPSFLFVYNIGNASLNWEELSLNISQKIYVLDIINKLNNRYKNYITPPEAVASCTFTENVEVRSLLINAKGLVVPCQFFYYDYIGNIFTDEVVDILNYDKLYKFYDIAKQRKNILKESSECNKCKLKPVCSYGCVGMADLKGNKYGYDGECRYRILSSMCYSNSLVTTTDESIKNNK